MAWIRVDGTLPAHRKTYRLAATLRVDRQAAVGLLVAMWLWASESDLSPDGEIEAGEPGDVYDHAVATMLAEAAAWRGEPGDFLAALLDARFLDQLPNGVYRFHDWYEWNGKHVARMKMDAKRKRNKRRRDADGLTLFPTDRPADGPTDRHAAVQGYTIRDDTGSKNGQDHRWSRDELAQAFDVFWRAYPKRAGANPKKAAAVHWLARIHAGVSIDEILTGVVAYANYCEACGLTGTERVKQANRWLSPTYEGWAQDWTPPEPRGPANPPTTKQLRATDGGTD